MINAVGTTGILHWIFGGFIQSYDLVTFAGSNLWWTTLAIWWIGVLWATIPSTTGTSSTLEAVFPKEYNYLLLIAALCFRTSRILHCDSLTRAYHNFYTASFLIIDISNMIESAQSYGPRSRKAACTAALNCCRALLFSGSCSKPASFSCYTVFGWEQYS